MVYIVGGIYLYMCVWVCIIECVFVCLPACENLRTWMSVILFPPVAAMQVRMRLKVNAAVDVQTKSPRMPKSC